MFNVIWKIDWMKSKLKFNDYQYMVVECRWTCTATETEYPDFKSEISGICSFTAPESEFTPYQDLTEQQVLDWVWNSGIDKETVETNAKRDLTLQINPPIVELPLPWSV